MQKTFSLFSEEVIISLFLWCDAISSILNYMDYRKAIILIGGSHVIFIRIKVTLETYLKIFLTIITSFELFTKLVAKYYQPQGYNFYR